MKPPLSGLSRNERTSSTGWEAAEAGRQADVDIWVDFGWPVVPPALLASAARGALTVRFDGYDEVLRGGMLVASHHGLEERQVSRIHQVFDDFLARHS